MLKLAALRFRSNPPKLQVVANPKYEMNRCLLAGSTTKA